MQWLHWVVNNCFRELLLALDKESNEQVAIKKVWFLSNKKTVENECQLLRDCLLHVFWRVERVEGVVGVLVVFCVMLVGNNEMLPLRFAGRVYSEGKSIEWKRIESSVELLFTGLIFSLQEKYDSQSKWLRYYWRIGHQTGQSAA